MVKFEHKPRRKYAENLVLLMYYFYCPACVSDKYARHCQGEMVLGTILERTRIIKHVMLI